MNEYELPLGEKCWNCNGFGNFIFVSKEKKVEICEKCNGKGYNLFEELELEEKDEE